MRERSRFDAIVVGGGHNGLVCAAYLARAGLAVCVLERAARPGGAAVTEEFHPGFRNSAASYTVSLLQQRIIDDLALHAHGLRIVPRPVANFVPSLTTSGLCLHRTVADTQQELQRFSSADAEHYPVHVAQMARLAAALRPLLLEAPADLTGSWKGYWRALRTGTALLRDAGADVGSLWELLSGSAGEWLQQRFATDALKAALGFDAMVGHFASPMHAGNGYLLLHHGLGQVNGSWGAWGHAMGGMGAISDALAAAGRRLGVTVMTDVGVDRICTTSEAGCLDYDDRVPASGTPGSAGMLTVHAAGRAFVAPVVVATVHPQRLFGGMVARDALPAAFMQRIDAWHSESAVFRVNVALSELPDFACRPGRQPAPHHGAGIILADSLDYMDDAWLDARRTGLSRRPVVEMLIPSTLDDSLAPPGRHVASLFCQHFRRHLPDGRSWIEAEDEALERIISTVDDYAPNFRRSLIAVQCYNPERLEQQFGLVGGDIFHGRMTPDQLYWSRPSWGHAQYRTPVPGLYLGGSGAHPGGGVSGAPGHNAARAVLDDLRRHRRRRQR